MRCIDAGTISSCGFMVDEAIVVANGLWLSRNSRNNLLHMLDLVGCGGHPSCFPRSHHVIHQINVVRIQNVLVIHCLSEDISCLSEPNSGLSHSC